MWVLSGWGPPPPPLILPEFLSKARERKKAGERPLAAEKIRPQRRHREGGKEEGHILFELGWVRGRRAECRQGRETTHPDRMREKDCRRRCRHRRRRLNVGHS